jgi:hypothetical protein
MKKPVKKKAPVKKAAAKPKAVGRPTAYKPEYCAKVIAMGKQGKSLAQMAAAFDVARSTIDQWAEQQAEFSEALARARTCAQDWWERQAEVGIKLKSADFNAQLWKTVVANRFREDYTETKVTQLQGPNGGPVQTQQMPDWKDITSAFTAKA